MRMKLFRFLTKDPIRIAIAVSLVIHAAALWKIPVFRKPPEPQASSGGPLIVQLAPRPTPPVRPQRPESTQRPLPAVPSKPRVAEPPRPARRPPVTARSDPAPAVPVPRPAPAVPTPPVAGDLASYIEAR